MSDDSTRIKTYEKVVGLHYSEISTPAHCIDSAFTAKKPENRNFPGSVGKVGLARPSQKRYNTTITPHSSSTDDWHTVGNQTTTISGFNTQPNHASLNQTIRAGITGFTGFYDTASPLENTQDSAIWKGNNPAYTGDGLHPSQAGHALIPTSGVIPIPVYP
jgi:hypothetical protein